MVVYAFTSNRGGVGKSFLASQTAVAVAQRSPTQTVVFLDLSIQGDASVALLGGVKEPTQFATGVATRGMENLVKVSQTSRAFLEAIWNRPKPARSFWRGTAALEAFDWRAHVVSVREAFPAGCAPHNIYLAAGGPSLHGTAEVAQVIALAADVRAALPANAVVIVDTDAELSERFASLLGLAIADSVVVVASASWQDMQRLISDPVNSLFKAMAFLRANMPAFRATVHTFVFNNLAKTSKEPCNHLAFTPPADTVRIIREIGAYVAGSPDVQPFLKPHADFFAEITAAVAVVPDGPKLKALETGNALVTSPRTEAELTAAAILEALAKRFN